MTPFIADSYTPAADASRVTIRSARGTEPYFRAMVFRERCSTERKWGSVPVHTRHGRFGARLACLML
jgi:hypothetical protein